MEKIDVALALLGVIAFGVTGIFAYVMIKAHGEPMPWIPSMLSVLSCAGLTIFLALLSHSAIVFFR